MADLPPLSDLARAVHDMVGIGTSRLHEWEELTYRAGLSPGQDVSFAGVRLMLNRGRAAERLLSDLCGCEAAFRAWYGSARLAEPGDGSSEPMAQTPPAAGPAEVDKVPAGGQIVTETHVALEPTGLLTGAD